MDSFRRLRLLLDRQAGTQFGLMLAAILLMAGLEMVGVAAILPFMRLVAEPALIESDPRIVRLAAAVGLEGQRQILIGLGVALLVIFAVASVVSAVTMWFIQRCVWSMAHRICMRLLRHYASLPYAFHLRNNSAELTKKVVLDVSDVVTGVLLAGCDLVAQSVLALLLFGLMLAVNPTVALGAFALLAGAYGIIHLVRHGFLRRLGRERLDASAARLGTFTEAMNGTKAIRIEGAAPFFIGRFDDASRRYADVQPRYMIARLAPRYAIELLAFGGLVVVVLVLLFTGRDLVAAIPSMTFFAMAAYKLLPALNRAFQGAAQLSHHLPAVDDVVADLKLAAEDRTAADPVDVESIAPVPFERELRLEGVSFAYDADRMVLQDIDLTIPRGGSVALIGATGSGKTTLVDIIIGLLPPTSGRFTVDGTPITPADAGGWRRRLAYVPQDIFLYDDTITRNIAFGVSEERIDHDRVREAARIAHLDAFIASELPGGYDTRIGERGVRLSGGQRQRIGLARAFYRRPALLVLDEATSALDGVTEQAVMQAIRANLPGVTVLMIAHRLSTIRHCDRIHLVEHGRIVDSGDWEHLSADNAAVRHMVEAAR
jgi:ATP-binding cassette subfamily C protein